MVCHTPLVFQRAHKWGNEGGKKYGGKERRERRLIGLLYEDDLIHYDELKENLAVIIGRFFEVPKKTRPESKCRQG